MNVWEFADKHPVMSTIWVIVISISLSSLINISIRKR